MLRFSNHRCAACSRNWNDETPAEILLCNELVNGRTSAKRVVLVFKNPLYSLNKRHRISGTDFTPYSGERENHHLWKFTKGLTPPQMYVTKREGQSTETSVLQKVDLTVVRCIYFTHIFIFN